MFSGSLSSQFATVESQSQEFPFEGDVFEAPQREPSEAHDVFEHMEDGFNAGSSSIVKAAAFRRVHESTAFGALIKDCLSVGAADLSGSGSRPSVLQAAIIRCAALCCGCNRRGELPFRRMECAPGEELQIDFGQRCVQDAQDLQDEMWADAARLLV